MNTITNNFQFKPFFNNILKCMKYEDVRAMELYKEFLIKKDERIIYATCCFYPKLRVVEVMNWVIFSLLRRQQKRNIHSEMNKFMHKLIRDRINVFRQEGIPGHTLQMTRDHHHSSSRHFGITYIPGHAHARDS